MGYKYVGLRPHCLDLIPPNAVCVELGVLEGYLSREILASPNVKRLYLIDPWLYFDGFWTIKDRNLKKEDGQTVLNEVFTAVVEEFSKDKRVIILREDQQDAYKHIKENIDWLYYDSILQYKPMMSTLEMYWDKITINGFIGGSSYDNPNVRQVLDIFIRKHINELSIMFASRGHMCDYFLQRLI